MGALKSPLSLARMAGRRRGRVGARERALTPTRALTLIVLVGALALGRCAPAGPRVIAYGKEACAYCLMTADDGRFGAELVTARGKVYVFDSPVCLAGYLHAHPAEKGYTVWVTDFTRPGTLLPAAQAQYRQTGRISGSMGVTIAALAPSDVAPPELTGPEMTWQDVLALAAQQERDALAQ